MGHEPTSLALTFLAVSPAVQRRVSILLFHSLLGWTRQLFSQTEAHKGVVEDLGPARAPRSQRADVRTRIGRPGDPNKFSERPSEDLLLPVTAAIALKF